MQRLNSQNRIDILPWQTPGLLARVGLTAQQTSEAAWFVDAQGAKHRGAAGINAALAAAQPMLKCVTWFYAVPGLRHIQDWVYACVARNRYRLPGSSAACAAPQNVDDVEG